MGAFEPSCILIRKLSTYLYQCMDLVDIDECTVNTDRCAHTCVNTPGSYSCFCRLGYVLNSDGYNCNGKL